ncbi:MAG: hypothetical protein HY921_09110 [Elusimicrobia bacterium]|nr:hypothetical protein [Elusimicrobiota bacterium]
MRHRRLFLAGFAGLSIGCAGEALLFLERQAAQVEKVLRQDFKIVLFLKQDLEESKRRILEEKLRALPDLEELRYVSRQEALAALRRQDPELVDAVVLLGENPLNPAYEARLSPLGVARVSAWIAAVQGLADWADIRYKTAQVQAILQVQFYRHFIDLSLSFLMCLATGMLLFSLWSAGNAITQAPGLELALVSGAGAVFGAAATGLAAWPLQVLRAGWAYPAGARQAALVLAAAAAGWVLCRRED